MRNQWQIVTAKCDRLKKKKHWTRMLISIVSRFICRCLSSLFKELWPIEDCKMYRNVLKNHFLNGQNSLENVSISLKLSWQMLLWILWNGQKIDSTLQTQLSTQTLDPTFFGHAKFEVKNFSLYLALWTLFPQVGGGGGGSRTQLFLVMPNLRSKNFPFI